MLAGEATRVYACGVLCCFCYFASWRVGVAKDPAVCGSLMAHRATVVLQVRQLDDEPMSGDEDDEDEDEDGVYSFKTDFVAMAEGDLDDDDESMGSEEEED